MCTGSRGATHGPSHRADQVESPLTSGTGTLGIPFSTVHVLCAPATCQAQHPASALRAQTSQRKTSKPGVAPGRMPVDEGPRCWEAQRRPELAGRIRGAGNAPQSRSHRLTAVFSPLPQAPLSLHVNASLPTRSI